jgi:hypothetical protein
MLLVLLLLIAFFTWYINMYVGLTCFTDIVRLDYFHHVSV